MYRFPFLKLIVIILLQACFTGQAYSQVKDEKLISLNCDNKPLRSVLDEIRIQGSINIIYSDDLVKNININCRIKETSAENALKDVISDYEISFRKFGSRDGMNSYVLYREKKKLKKRYQALIINQKTSGFDTSSFFTAPIMITNLKIRYPDEAAKNNIEGNVYIKFLIDRNGEVSRTNIEKSSGSNILDSATAVYARNLKFIPAQNNGQTRSIWMTMVFKYLISHE
jgi:TonB family protein